MRPTSTFAAACRALLRDRKGATAVEYGLILGLIVLMMFVALSGFARQAIAIWNAVASKVVALTS